MSLTATALLAVLGLAALVLVRRQEPVPGPGPTPPAVVVLVLALGGLGLVALLGAMGGPLDPVWQRVLVDALAVVLSVAGGGVVAVAVLRLADPAARRGNVGPADPDVLRGGVWIGALERAGVAGALLAGRPEGIALVLAVKGFGRYPELRAPAAAERFIIGTFASVLWSCAVVAAANPLVR